jgi:hypothetical protein
MDSTLLHSKEFTGHLIWTLNGRAKCAAFHVHALGKVSATRLLKTMPPILSFPGPPLHSYSLK